MKLYESKAFLELRYVKQKKTIEEIAKECNVSLMTIQRYLKQFGFLKKDSGR